MHAQGTFAHPWQQSLTVWGDELVRTLGAELLTWLRRHAQSPQPHSFAAFRAVEGVSQFDPR